MLPNDPDLDVSIIEDEETGEEREEPSQLSRIARSIREGLGLGQDDIAEAHVVGEPNPASMAEWEREHGILYVWVPNSYEMPRTARRIAGLAWADPIPAPRA